jgi:proteic killer suppression protein
VELTIETSWSDHKLEKKCASDRLGQREWGAEHWRLLKRRLASLRASPTLKSMEGVPGHCHQLGADRREQFAVDLWGSYRLVFVADHDPIPRLQDGGIDRSLITKVLIVEVVDYHGE